MAPSPSLLCSSPAMIAVVAVGRGEVRKAFLRVRLRAFWPGMGVMLAVGISGRAAPPRRAAPAAALREQALRSLRHLLRTHVTGDLDRVGGGRWGDVDRVGLVVGPLVAASRLLSAPIMPRDKAGIERVVIHEADRLLAQAPAS